MAKKVTASAKKTAAAPKNASSQTTSSAVRNSAIPKAVAPVAKKLEITHDQIARRAYEIHLSGSGGSESDNWHRAERELRAGL